jgi:hypothetical protein
MEYKEFIFQKSQLKGEYGFDPLWIPDFLFDFQKSLIEWNLKKGKSALFADCGLGKTPMELVWAQNVIMKTNGRILLLTPLAVTYQTLQESEKFNIEAHISKDGSLYPITITNYEKLHYFNPEDFQGIICDESSILKNFDGERKNQITQFMRKIPYRLLATATSAPNDYIELGTSSEALGYLGYIDMLNRFFKNDQNNTATKRLYGKAQMWRFKGHAEEPFWKWVSFWSRALRKPSDLGFSDERFIRPGVVEKNYLIENSTPLPGYLWNMPAVGLSEQREESKRTLTERCEKVAELCQSNEPHLVWCNLNEEGLLLAKIIPDSLEVAGRHSDEVKEERLLGFKNGNFKTLITKPKIGAWGLNYQHCSHVVTFPTNSYESYYQGLHRCDRFGQTKIVRSDFVTTSGGEYLFKNLTRKAVMASKMYDRLIAHMNDSVNVENKLNTNEKINVPTWM